MNQNPNRPKDINKIISDLLNPNSKGYNKEQEEFKRKQREILNYIQEFRK